MQRCVEASESLEETDASWTLQGPSAVVTQIKSDILLQEAVTTVIKGCKVPTFIPLTNSVLQGGSSKEDDKINPVAFVAVHAIQILMFAPMDWEEDRQYVTDAEAYTHRYPTPTAFGGSEDAGLGQFSWEDFHRAVCMFNMAITRRESTARNVLGRVPPDSDKPRFEGYYDPTAKDEAFAELDEQCMARAVMETGLLQEAQAMELNKKLSDLAEKRSNGNKTQLVTPTKMSVRGPRISGNDAFELFAMTAEVMDTHVARAKMERLRRFQDIHDELPGMSNSDFRALFNSLKIIFSYADPDLVFKLTRQSVDGFLELLKEDSVENFMNTINNSDVISEDAQDTAAQVSEVAKRYENAYKFERFMNAHRPPKLVDFEKICTKYNISKFPELALYPGRSVQTLKPHQAADCDIMLEKIAQCQHVILANDMGLGKTKEMFALIEMHVRQLELLDASDPEDKAKVKFYPSLIVNPVNTILQTFEESKQHPTLTVLVYYATQEQFPGKNARVIRSKGLMAVLENLMSKTDDPETGRTVILTTFPTLYTREFRKRETRFAFKDKHAKVKGSKRVGKGQSSKSRKKPRLETLVDYSTSDEEEPSDIDDQMDSPELFDKPESTETDQSLEQAEQEDNSNKRLRKYYGLPFDEADIIRLEKGSKIKPDGNLIEFYFKRNEKLSEIKWQFLIVDEAHMARRMNGAYNHMFRLLGWKTLVWVSGTVMISGLQDILSPIALMWQKYEFGHINWDQLTLGDITHLWHEQYDPCKKVNSINGKETPGIFYDKNGLIESEAGLRLYKFWLDYKWPIWQLCPDLVKMAGDQGKWNVSFAKNVISKILSLLSLRRTLRTPPELPNGEISYPALEIPPMTVRTEELRYDFKNQAIVRQHGEAMAAQMVRQTPTGDLIDFTPTKGLRPDVSGEGGQINFGSYREGVLGVFDVRNIRLLSMDAAEFFGHNRETAAQELRLLRDCNLEKTTTEVKNSEKTTTPVILGVEHVRDLAMNSVHGGLDFFYGQTRTDRNIPTLVGPQQWTRWLCGGSPILSRLMELCYKYVRKQGERLVAYVDTPFMQNHVIEALRMAGFRVNTVRSSDKGSRKAREIAQFVDPDSGSQIFVANVNILATGVNLQTCCSKGVLLSWHYNAKTLTQIFHRLHRIGQKKDVVWHVLKVNDSFHDHQERLLGTKWAKQMSAEMDLEDWYPDNIRELIIFEFQRAYFHQPYNRYAWILLRDLSPSAFAYNSELTVKVAHAVTCVAKLCMAADAENRAFWEEASEDLAEALVSFCEEYSVVEMAELALKDIDDLYDTLTDIRKHVALAKENSKKKRKADVEARERVKDGLKRRKEEAFKSEEFVYDSDESDSSDVARDVDELDDGEAD